MLLSRQTRLITSTTLQPTSTPISNPHPPQLAPNPRGVSASALTAANAHFQTTTVDHGSRLAVPSLRSEWGEADPLVARGHGQAHLAAVHTGLKGGGGGAAGVRGWGYEGPPGQPVCHVEVGARRLLLDPYWIDSRAVTSSGFHNYDPDPDNPDVDPDRPSLDGLLLDPD